MPRRIPECLKWEEAAQNPGGAVPDSLSEYKIKRKMRTPHPVGGVVTIILPLPLSGNKENGSKCAGSLQVKVMENDAKVRWECLCLAVGITHKITALLP